ncbi:hypothetical protein KSF_087720 [Reticulibacter mediterranei]|uniref:Uncharacterized protein n=1 Tax=Reticulibacter mediterranei TaxID=2778369 RepID=A0A8J3N552_9CHLR|nr:hypothetical protein [Reticulibacter mediterranei]GHO98724.1 hypothetical protein KSF_087720 [Reticulibacter mediterranei]
MGDDLFVWLDPLFAFIDPLVGLTKEDVSLFLAQSDTVLASPQGGARLPMATLRPLTEETYKEMCMLRYKHHLGQITFLELLEQYEEILGISSHSISEQ